MSAKTKLLFGPYRPPRLKVWQRASCLYRDTEVVIFGWTAAKIPWPRCYVAGTRAAGQGLLVDDELARAVRSESSAAIQHWWGVCSVTVTKWRRALGVGRKGSEGSCRLIRRAAETGLSACRNYAPPAEVRLWAAWELALLGERPDAVVAARTGRTVSAVSTRRRQMGIPAVRAGRPTRR
jgi:hypothetical protein